MEEGPGMVLNAGRRDKAFADAGVYVHQVDFLATTITQPSSIEEEGICVFNACAAVAAPNSL